MKIPSDKRKEIIEQIPRPKEKRPLIDEIMSIIKEMSEKSEKGITRSEIKERLIDFGLSEVKFNEILDFLVENGHIYEKNIGYFKSI